jgi:uncharacterized protein
MKFGLSPQDYEVFEALVLRPLKAQGAHVWIFGSRVRGDHKEFSDVDILFEKTKDFPPGFLFELKDAIENSNFPFKLDLVDRSELASSYTESVERDKQAL